VNAPTNTSVTGEYGGNISQMTWQTRGREKQSYTFKYDYINRMTEADYADISNAGAVTNDRYTEKLTYDIRGNIQTLQRYGYNSNSCGWGLIDNLSYNYGAYGYNPYNKVNSITESSDVSRGFVTQSNGSAYTYDVDGNMTVDPNKGITGITYNHLNLPTLITFTGNRTITFLYDAGGNKLRKTVVNNGTTLYTQDYVNGIEYKNGALEAIYHSEGRVTNIDGSLKYEYAMKDHLGNTRLMFCDRNGDGVIKPENAPEPSEVTQENSYYAFGMNMEFGAWENTPSVTDNLYLYNNRELNTDFGLNWEHNDWRFYDPTVGRFWSIDKEAEKPNQVDYTPYHFGFNNPIRNSDPTGLEGEPCCGGPTSLQGVLSDGFGPGIRDIAQKIDNLSVIVKEKIETIINTITNGLTTTETSSSLEVKTTYSTNLKDGFDYVKNNNTSSGGPAIASSKTEVSTSTDTKTQVAAGPINISSKSGINQDGSKGNTKIEASGVYKKAQVSLGIGTSINNKGETTATINGLVGTKTTKGTAAVNIGSNGKTSIEVGVQKQVSPKVKVSFSIGVSN